VAGLLLALLATGSGAAPAPESARGGPEIFAPSAASDPTPVLAPHFEDRVAITGLTFPTVVRFAGNGQVFVGEKSGVIKVFDGLNDPTPTVFADLSANVFDFWDRGLLGLALAPTYPTDPHVYVLYTLDGRIGETPPVYHDQCTDPNAACVAGARLSRLTMSGGHMVGPEEVLAEGWCQQFPSHSIGTVMFDADGALLAGAGDGASFTEVDYGQFGTAQDPPNPCGDPGGPNPTPPTAEGGALRSQALRTSGDPTGLSGAIIRVDPATGDALPDNPLFGGAVADDDRIVATGMRNPYRFVRRPGTDEIWVGDVGWNAWEEIDTMASPIDPVVENFGWPCFEGAGAQPQYDATGLAICEDLYGDPGSVSAPLFSYRHGQPVVPGDGCPLDRGSVISGMAFYRQGTYPPAFRGSLFFGDHARLCIWVMLRGPDGRPDPSRVRPFVRGARGPVALEIGPGGDLYYVAFEEGTIHRVVFTGS
jgi:glucose/arabinose dehydrogenase